MTFSRLGSLFCCSAGEAIVLNNLGEVYFGMEEFDQAEKYALEALSIRTTLSNQYGVMISRNLLAKIYQRKGAKEQAIAYADSSLRLAYEANSTTNSLISSGLAIRLRGTFCNNFLRMAGADD